jgi:ATP-binding cassette subfamily F protein 3
LLLDEPTNHLDIEMREALAEALQDYAGTLVVVAHDRHLLRATTDTLWLVDRGRVAPFDGDLDDYRDWVLARNRRDAVTDTPSADAAPSRKDVKRAEAQARQRAFERRKPLADRLATIEAEMQALAKRKSGLDDWLASPDAYADDAKSLLVERLAEQGDLAWRLARLEEEWLDVSETLENL